MANLEKLQSELAEQWAAGASEREAAEQAARRPKALTPTGPAVPPAERSQVGRQAVGLLFGLRRAEHLESRFPGGIRVRPNPASDRVVFLSEELYPGGRQLGKLTARKVVNRVLNGGFNDPAFPAMREPLTVPISHVKYVPHNSAEGELAKGSLRAYFGGPEQLIAEYRATRKNIGLKAPAKTADRAGWVDLARIEGRASLMTRHWFGPKVEKFVARGFSMPVTLGPVSELPAPKPEVGLWATEYDTLGGTWDEPIGDFKSPQELFQALDRFTRPFQPGGIFSDRVGVSLSEPTASLIQPQRRVADISDAQGRI